jgi:hypothetical protein
MAGKDVAIFCVAAGWLMVVGWLWLLYLFLW